MTKGAGNISNGDATINDASRSEPKRPYQWFAGASEPELLPNKKQAVEAPNNQSSADISNSNVSCWGNTSSFQSVPNQFMDRLFGPERSVNFPESNVPPVGRDDDRQKGIDENFRDDASVGLSISHSMEDAEAPCFNYGGIRKVKVSQVKDSNNGLHTSVENSFDREGNIALSTDQESQSSYIAVGQAYDKEDNNVMLVGQTYNRGNPHVGTTEPTCGKGEGQMTLPNTYSKEEANMISFVGFHDEHHMISMAQPISSYEPSYHQSSVHTSQAASEKLFNSSNAEAVVAASQSTIPKPESVIKKPEFKTPKKEAPNSFPSNVRSLISTGMLDGVPVKYVSVSREVSFSTSIFVRLFILLFVTYGFFPVLNKELRGIIKGSGYLCGCQICNYNRVSHSTD